MTHKLSIAPDIYYSFVSLENPINDFNINYETTFKKGCITTATNFKTSRRLIRSTHIVRNSSVCTIVRIFLSFLFAMLIPFLIKKDVELFELLYQLLLNTSTEVVSLNTDVTVLYVGNQNLYICGKLYPNVCKGAFNCNLSRL